MDLGDLGLILISAFFGLSAGRAFVLHGATRWAFARLFAAAAAAVLLIGAHVVPDGSPLEALVVVIGGAGMFAAVAILIVSTRDLGVHGAISGEWRLLASLRVLCVAVVGTLASMTALVVAFYLVVPDGSPLEAPVAAAVTAIRVGGLFVVVTVLIILTLDLGRLSGVESDAD